MSTDSVELHPQAAAIAARLSVVDTELCLSDEDFQAAWKQVEATPPAEREELGQHLLALAVKIQREGEGAGAVALAQLYLMVGRLVSDFARAKLLFEAGGVDLSRALEWMGTEASKLPVATGSIAGGDSLFALRLGKTGKKR